MPQATYLNYEGVGHNTHIDNAEQVVQDMIAFVEGN